MERTLNRAIPVIWVLSLVMALNGARYFLNPVPGLFRGEVLALGRHTSLVLVHIAAGIVAITTGLFQFIPSLRKSSPAAHRVTGFIYLASVLVGGAAAFALSPDTPQFAADLLTEKPIDLSSVGINMASLGYGPSSVFVPSQFFLVMIGFFVLSIVWPLTSLVAFERARQRRFADHRAWMIRSYCLTFAAVSVRLAGLPFLILTRNPVVAITLTFWSWILNLIVAEGIIRLSKRAVEHQEVMA
jgi:hypothetical protein